MSVVEALRTTPKGQLSYSRVVDTNRLKDELDQLSSPPLSHYHSEKENSLNQSFGLNSSKDSIQDFNENSSCFRLCPDDGDNKASARLKHIPQAFSELDDELEKSDSSKPEDVFDTSLPMLHASNNTEMSRSSATSKKQASSCPVSPQFGITTGAILDEEAMWDSFAQLCHLRHVCQFEDHERALSYLMRSKMEAVDQKMQRLLVSRDGMLKQKQDECVARSQSKLRRLKEGHQEHIKRIHTKELEIVRHKEKLQEEEKRRQELELSRTKELMVLVGEVQASRNSFVQVLEGCPLRDRLPDIVDKYRAVLDKVCNNMSQQMLAGAPVTDEQLTKAREDRVKSQKAVTLLQAHIAEAEVRKKEEEVKKELQTKKQEEERKLVAEAAQDMGVQSLAYVLKEYQTRAVLLAETDTHVQAFVANTALKKYRFDLQRAVNTPINAISPVSGSHLRDKLRRLHGLLTGQPVEVAGKQVALNDSAPQAKTFCQNLVAKMLVKKGEEQVTSNHESAFAIASVVVGLWVEEPAVGGMFMGHLQAACPYVLPLYNVQREGQPKEDYYRSLGYKIMEDKSIEEQDKFLHRMSGLMNLYCACIVSTPPKGPASAHPHGLEHAWMWLARTLNMEPHPDITASMLYDLLVVTGHFLLQQYRTQFVKMLHIIYKQFLPKLKSVSVTKSTVGRLEIFLETTIQNNGRIDPPKGLLPPNFFMS